MGGRWLKWAIAAVAFGVLVALVLPVFSVLQPGYWSRYPALAQRMEHWKTSTHSRVSCVQCHVEPGVGGFTSFAARSIPAFYSQLISGPNTTNLLTAPGVKACRKCHTTYRKIAPSGDLLIPHRAHVEVLKLDCTVCHKDLVHSLNKRGFNRPEMETCLAQCHNGDTASNKCSDCHTQKQVPASHKQPNWLQVHGEMAETIDCGKCHDWTPNYCADCHAKKPASHVGNWKTNHSAIAKQRGSGCLVCHKQSFCKECH
ncbi:MAG TPA: hypothetical protein VFG89_09505 [Coriobacteriia bacterium]|nr:hypothetical protein [Coriobacteriia bacterium]